MDSPLRKTFSHQPFALPPVLLYAHPSMESLAMEIADRCALSQNLLSSSTAKTEVNEATDVDPTHSQVRFFKFFEFCPSTFSFSRTFYLVGSKYPFFMFRLLKKCLPQNHCIFLLFIVSYVGGGRRSPTFAFFLWFRLLIIPGIKKTYIFPK